MGLVQYLTLVIIASTDGNPRYIGYTDRRGYHAHIYQHGVEMRVTSRKPSGIIGININVLSDKYPSISSVKKALNYNFHPKDVGYQHSCVFIRNKFYNTKWAFIHFYFVPYLELVHFSPLTSFLYDPAGRMRGIETTSYEEFEVYTSGFEKGAKFPNKQLELLMRRDLRANSKK